MSIDEGNGSGQYSGGVSAYRAHGNHSTNGVHSEAQAGPWHVGIIMDGNGRWAKARHVSRYDGYRAGTDAVREAVESAADLGIGVLTLYAFSSDNWRRPSGEVQLLLSLFQWYLQRETRNCVNRGVRVSFVGRRDRFPASLNREIERSEAATRSGDQRLLRIAADYSARDAILAAASLLEGGDKPTRSDFSRMLTGGDGNLAQVDLIVRTGGEQRLSDFLLWEAAYAELVFTSTLWPDFKRADLEETLAEFRRRERRFGGSSPTQGRPMSMNEANGTDSAGRLNSAQTVESQTTKHPGRRR